jgi:hypothetical protein
MRDPLTHDTPIYHELLILSLETLCQQFDSTYLDPAFFPNMRTQGWQAVARRFGTHYSLRWPKIDFHNIAIPVHVNGNHWVAICHRKIGRTTYFFYADDLNNPRTEQELNIWLQQEYTNRLLPTRCYLGALLEQYKCTPF